MWPFPADLDFSCTQGVNVRIGLCKKAGLEPTLIRLGRKHTRRFLSEHGLGWIPNRPFRSPSGYLSWDPERRLVCYSNAMIPMKFNDPRIVGIVVEGKPRA